MIQFYFARNLRTLLITGALVAANAQAGQVEINHIESAAAALDLTTLSQITESAQGYDLALALYRLALTANLTGEEEVAQNAIDESIALLEELNKQESAGVEEKALLAQVYGYKVALNPLKGIYYGPKSQSMLAQAEAIDPNNPRVLLVKGIGAINTPPMFGGSAEQAVEAFTAAIKMYEQDAYSDYHWGFAEAYTWRGLVHMQQDNSAKAIADWQKALEINPQYGWAKSLMAQSDS